MSLNMLSKMGVVASPNCEDVLRLFIILNDVIGMSLCFKLTRFTYIIMGTMLVISLCFNLVVILVESRETRIRLKKNEPVQPSLVALGIETFGTGAFLSIYILSIIDTIYLERNYGWWDASEWFIHIYAGVAGMIAL
jgi:hypothetical protein